MSNEIDNLKKLTASRSITRREFVSGAIALGVTATVASNMFTSAQAATP
ncbi:MAG: hypothetical protein ACR2OR_13840 [Hyphomicrobiales bacterium]